MNTFEDIQAIILFVFQIVVMVAAVVTVYGG